MKLVYAQYTSLYMQMIFVIGSAQEIKDYGSFLFYKYFNKNIFELSLWIILSKIFKTLSVLKRKNIYLFGTQIVGMHLYLHTNVCTACI